MKKKKHIPHSFQDFKDTTVVNPTLPSLHGGSLDIELTVPLSLAHVGGWYTFISVKN